MYTFQICHINIFSKAKYVLFLILIKMFIVWAPMIILSFSRRPYWSFKNDNLSFKYAYFFTLCIFFFLYTVYKRRWLKSFWQKFSNFFMFLHLCLRGITLSIFYVYCSNLPYQFIFKSLPSFVLHAYKKCWYGRFWWFF